MAKRFESFCLICVCQTIIKNNKQIFNFYNAIEKIYVEHVTYFVIHFFSTGIDFVRCLHGKKKCHICCHRSMPHSYGSLRKYGIIGIECMSTLITFKRFYIK